MRRGGGFIQRIDRDRPEHAELHRHRLLERRAALRLLDVMGERRPWQRDAAALGLGRGGLRFRAADHRHAAFAARDALCGFVDVADRALAADRAVITMRGLGAEPRRKLLLGIAVAPAQEIDDVERAELAEQLCPAVRLRAPDALASSSASGSRPAAMSLGRSAISPTPTMTGMRSSGRGELFGIFSCFAF